MHNKEKQESSWIERNHVWLGWVVVVVGVCLGLYVGLYVMFVGGIIQIISQIGAVNVSAAAIAWGVVKMLFAAVVGWLITLAFVFPGVALASNKIAKHRRNRW